MSLRDFLLEYAEVAPKTYRSPVYVNLVRFETDRGSLCPLELAGDLDEGEYEDALERYELGGHEARAITAGADQGNSKFPEYRAWRAILKKLAEPEVRS